MNMKNLTLVNPHKITFCHETLPLRQQFRISRGVKNAADVIYLQVHYTSDTNETIIGQGESVPYTRYNESIEKCLNQLEEIKNKLPNLTQLQNILPAGAARNALDCALWDLQFKLDFAETKRAVGTNIPQYIQSAYTLSIDTPEKMAQAALKNKDKK